VNWRHAAVRAGLVLLRADAAQKMVSMLWNEVYSCDDPETADVPSAYGHYDPGAAFVGNPSGRTLTEVRSLVYNTTED
jgi:hypothetical protein